MSEIEKMMQNANVKKYWNSTPYGGIEEYYPPFTAEKQLKIMELLVKKGMLLFTFSTQKNYKVSGFCRGSDYCSDINEALANYINNLWQDLTEEEKQQVKGILE